MKRPPIIIISALFVYLLTASGCAYTLRYTLKTSLDRQESPRVPSAGVPPKTFTAEQMLKRGRAGFSMEKKLLVILSQNLENLGWSSVSDEEGAASPAYTFTVDFERPEPIVYPGFGFSASTGSGSGFFFSTMFDTRWRDNLYVIWVTASPPDTGHDYTWSAEIRTESSAANLLDLARRALPKALERFPNPGYWELKERVVPREEPSRGKSSRGKR